MFSYIWPLALVVVSNTLYQVCSKSTPADISPFAALSVTYLIGCVSCLVLYFALSKNGDLIREYSKLSWSSIVLGIVIVGLEVGSIFAYKAGWKINTFSITQGSLYAIALLFVGFLFFGEQLTWNKIAGMLICVCGLAVINLK